MMASVLRDFSHPLTPCPPDSPSVIPAKAGIHNRRYPFRHFLSIFLLLPLLTGFTAKAIAQSLPVISIANAPGQFLLVEGATASFTISADANVSADLVVNLSVSEQPGSDYVAPGDKGADTVTILMGTSSITYMVPTVDDMIVEENGLFRVTVGSSTADPATYAVAAGSSGYADIIMSDNDFPVISVNFPLVDGLPIRQIGGNSHAEHKEATEEVTFEVISTPAPSSTLTVCLNVAESGGSRLSSTSKGAKTVTIPANATSVDYDVTWSDDTDDEVYSLIKVTGVDPADASCSQTGYELPLSGTSDQALVEDNDPTVVSLARIGTGAVTEGTAIEFTVTLGRALVAGERIEVPYTVSGTNVVAADWSVALKPGNGINTGVTDTNSGNTQLLHFNAGAQVATVLLTPTVDDTTESTGSETYTIALGNNAAFDARTLTNVGGGADPSSTANTFNVVVNDNAIPVISIRHTNYSSLTLNNPPQTEGATGSFTLTATPAFAGARRVNIMVTDAPNADYVPTGNQGARTVQFQSSGNGAETQTYSFGIPTDNIDEPNGRVTATLVAGTGYTIDADESSHFFDARDNDPTTVTLEVTDALAEEGSATAAAEITLTLGRALRAGESLAIPLQFSGGALNTDFILSSSTSNTISLDLTNGVVAFTGAATGSATVATISLIAAQDDADTDDETVIVSIPAASTGNAPILTATGLGGGATGSRTGNGEITLDDNDIPTAAPVMTIAPTTANTPVTEGTAASFTITATTPSGTTVPARTVNLTVADAPNADFVSSTNQGSGKTVSIPSSSTNTSTATYTVATDNGNTDTDEPSGPVTVTIATGTGYTGTGSASITVNDNDATTVTLARSGGTSAIGEDGGTATLTVTLGRRLRATETVTAPLTVTGSGIVAGDYTLALASGSSLNSGVTLNTASPHSAATPAVVFSGHDTNTVQTATLTLTAVEDTTDEGASETLTVGFGSSSRAVMSNLDRTSGTGAGGTTPTGTVAVVITDNDTRGLTFSPASPPLMEGGSNTYTVKLNTQPSEAVTVTISGHASTDLTLDTDSGTNGNQNTLTFNPTGAKLWSTAQPVTVTAAEDDDTTDDTVILTHRASGGDYGSVSQNLNVTLTDNEPEPNVFWADSRTTGTVDESAGTITANRLEVTRELEEALVISYTLSGSAMAGTDYTIPGATYNPDGSGSGTFTIPAGRAFDLGDQVDFPITLTPDNTADNGETITVTLTDGNGYGLGTGVSFTRTIIENTGVATFSITGNARVGQTLTVTRTANDPDGNGAGALTYGWGWRESAQDNTITQIVHNAASYTIPAEHLGRLITCTINYTDGNGFAHSVSAGHVGPILAVQPDPVDPPPSTQPGTTPDPSPTTPGETPTEPQPPQEPQEPEPVIPVLSIQAQSDTLTEGAVATFTITAEPAPVEPISVSLTIAGQGDFTASESTGVKTRVIDRATTSLMIPTIQDFIDEEDGSVTVTLQPADGYTLATDSATITIHDDDTAGFQPSAQGLRIPEIGQSSQYTMQLISQPTAPVTITLSAQPGAATVTPSLTSASASPHNAFTPPDIAIITFSPSSLTFTKDNWNTPQTFTLTAQQEGAVTLTHVITSQDPNYAAMQSRQAPLRVVVGEDLTTVAIPWQTRFARTQAGHVLDSISDRIQSTPTPGLSARLAGYRMDTRTPQEIQSWTQPPNSIARPHSRAITMSELLSDSSMSWSATTTDGSIASLWAQGAFSEFDGQSGETTLNGEVLTTLLGVDQTHTHGQRGLVLSYSQAEGQYQTKNKGEIESEQTLLTPWMSRQVNDRMTLWGALGYGTGDLTLIRSERQDLTTDTHTAFVALGSDAILREETHRTLSIVTDALWLRTRTEAVTDGLELNHATAHASRMRVGIKGSGRIPAIPGIPRFTAVQALKMNWESALRHDGGDAESGFGVEVGGGVQWTDSRRGLNLQINGRSLITHHDSDIKDRGLSLSMGFNPSPAEQGFTFTLKQDWGTVSSGRERLLSAESLEPAQSATGQRFKAQAGYGFTIGDGRYIARPHLGVGLYAKERETTLGWRLQSTIGRSERTLGLKLTRHDNDNQSEHRMKVEAGMKW